MGRNGYRGVVCMGGLRVFVGGEGFYRSYLLLIMGV